MKRNRSKMNKKDGLVYITFLIRGEDVIPTEISQKLGIEPDRQFTKGEIKRNGQKWPHGYFEISTQNKINSQDFEDHLAYLVDILHPRKDEILRIQDTTHCECLISCYADIYYSHFGFSFPREQIRLLCDLGLALQCDFYLSGEQETV